MIDGAILDGKIMFWTVNFPKSQKQPHTDNTGNEWDLSLARCLAAAGSSGAPGRAQYRRRRAGLKAPFVFLLFYCNMCDRLLHHNQGNPVHPSLPPPSPQPVSQYISTCTCSPDCLTSNFPALFSGLIPCCLSLTSLSRPPSPGKSLHFRSDLVSARSPSVFLIIRTLNAFKLLKCTLS